MSSSPGSSKSTAGCCPGCAPTTTARPSGPRSMPSPPLLARYLQKLTLRRTSASLTRLTSTHSCACLSTEPRQAARWWQAVEERFARTGRWDWARSLTSRLLSEDGAVAPANPADPGERPESRLRAAVLATHAAAAIHLDTVPAVGWAWQEVAAKAATHPTREGCWSLRVRSTAGQIAALRLARAHGSAPLGSSRTIIRRWREAVRRQLTASCLAAIEAVVEREETSAEPRLLYDAVADPDAPKTGGRSLRSCRSGLLADGQDIRRAGPRTHLAGRGRADGPQVSLGPLCEPSADLPRDQLAGWGRPWPSRSPPAVPPGLAGLASAGRRLQPGSKLEFVRAAYPSSLSPSGYSRKSVPGRRAAPPPRPGHDGGRRTARLCRASARRVRSGCRRPPS